MVETIRGFIPLEIPVPAGAESTCFVTQEGQGWCDVVFRGRFERQTEARSRPSIEALRGLSSLAKALGREKPLARSPIQAEKDRPWVRQAVARLRTVA